MYENNFEGGLEVFKKTIYSLFPLPESDFEKLSQVLHYKKYNKGDVILTEGKVCRHFWYILKGCVRMFSTETGLEVNVHFYFEGSLATDFISLRHNIPSNFSIVAVEDTEVLYSYKPDYKPVIHFSKELTRMAAEFFAENLVAEIEHGNSFKLMNPEERYINLLITRPKYIQRIPLTYLASYLGMSRKTLSRIRSNTN